MKGRIGGLLRLIVLCVLCSSVRSSRARKSALGKGDIDTDLRNKQANVDENSIAGIESQGNNLAEVNKGGVHGTLAVIPSERSYKLIRILISSRMKATAIVTSTLVGVFALAANIVEAKELLLLPVYVTVVFLVLVAYMSSLNCGNLWKQPNGTAELKKSASWKRWIIEGYPSKGRREHFILKARDQRKLIRLLERGESLSYAPEYLADRLDNVVFVVAGIALAVSLMTNLNANDLAATRHEYVQFMSTVGVVFLVLIGLVLFYVGEIRRMVLLALLKEKRVYRIAD